MQILANALPGFRDLRAPLIAGYMWVVFVWLLFTPDFQTRPAGELGAVYDLAKDVGPVWVGIAVATAAYLAGSVSQIVSEILSSGLRRIGPRWLVGDIAPYDPGSSLDAIYRAGRGTVDRMLDPTTDLSHRYQNELSDLRSEAEHGSLIEPNLPATLLVGQQPELYAEVDRLRAEGDLRLAVIPPLLALTTLLATKGSPWCLIALPAIFALLSQGLRRVAESRKLIIDAFSMGRITSPSVKRFSDWVGSLPDRISRESSLPATVDRSSLEK
jgi:hypothetical protein